MEKSKKLYPFIIKGDSLNANSVISNGFLEGNTLEDAIDTYMMDILGLEVFKYFRGEFPLEVTQKHIENFTPVMVCPSDETSLERYGVPGNVKMWYVKDAASTAKIVFGLRREITATELFDACHKGILEEYLQVIRPMPGDFILIPPGVMHAIGGDIEYVEVASACGANYHLYDVNPAEKVKIYANMAGYSDSACGVRSTSGAEVASNGSGRDTIARVGESGYPYDPELFEAIDIIDYKPASLAENYLTTLHSDNRMVTWPLHFVAKFAKLSESIKVLPAIANSFIAYVGLKGEAQVKCNGVSYPISEGTVLLVPSVIDDYDLEPVDSSASVGSSGSSGSSTSAGTSDPSGFSGSVGSSISAGSLNSAAPSGSSGSSILAGSSGSVASSSTILEIYIPPIDLECDAPEDNNALEAD